jgi:hypothetical protein
MPLPCVICDRPDTESGLEAPSSSSFIGNNDVFLTKNFRPAAFTGVFNAFTNHTHRKAAAPPRKPFILVLFSVINLLENGIYAGNEPGDARHPRVERQDIYYAVAQIGDKTLGIRFKADIPKYIENYVV